MYLSPRQYLQQSGLPRRSQRQRSVLIAGKQLVAFRKSSCAGRATSTISVLPRIRKVSGQLLGRDQDDAIRERRRDKKKLMPLKGTRIYIFAGETFPAGAQVSRRRGTCRT